MNIEKKIKTYKKPPKPIIRGLFKKTYTEQGGEDVFDFLCLKANYVRYLKAVKLEKPPVAYISDLLLAVFGPKIAENNYKRFIGYCILLIMRENEFQKTKPTKIEYDNVFLSGHTYS